MLKDLAQSFQMLILPPDQLIDQKVIKYEFKSTHPCLQKTDYQQYYKKLLASLRELKEQLTDLNRLVNRHSDQFYDSLNKLTHAAKFINCQEKRETVGHKTNRSYKLKFERQYNLSSRAEVALVKQQLTAKQNVSENERQLIERLKNLQQKMRATKRKYSNMSSRQFPQSEM